MSEIVLDGGQSGLTTDEIVAHMADNWGGPVSSNRFRNATLRRINSALRDIHLKNKGLREYRVIAAPVYLKAGVQQYDVRDVVDNGGWGWTHCAEVLELVVGNVDDRPLEKLNPQRWRNRSELLDQTGAPESWFPIDSRRVLIQPTPDMDYTGQGDFMQTTPEITSGSLDWPPTWDQAILLGTDFYWAQIRMRGNPAAVREYERRFRDAIADIEWNDKQFERVRAVATRDLRSARHLARDNSRDLGRWWR